MARTVGFYGELETKMEKIMNEILLNRLLRHFREPNASYSELQRQQVIYVYDYAVKRVGPEVKDVFNYLAELERDHQTRRLNTLYQILKIESMINSRHYDFNCYHVPMDYNGYDKGWKL